MIPLSCKPSDPLDWDIQSFPQEGPLFFRFDLGLEAPYFPIDDEMQFQSLSLALTKFTQEIWPLYQDRIRGAVLYRGSADFSACFSWTEKQKENWEVWIGERPAGTDAQLRRLFCADAFAHYFQMLAHRLPDEMPLYLLLDGTGIGSIAERHQLLSRERFEHFLVATKGLPFTNGLVWDGEEIREPQDKPPHALCFPEERSCSGAILEKMEQSIRRFETPFRVIPEAFLTEEWEGVDALYVFKEMLSPQGDRKVKGFLATGGVVHWI